MTTNNLNIVIGLGKTGLSCVRYCLRHHLPVAVMDAAENPPGAQELKEIAPDVPTLFGSMSKKFLEQASRLIVSPGVSLHHPAIAKVIAKGVPYVGDIELFVNHIKAPIVAITGSNAKGTVTTLVGDMAKEAGIKVQVAGNIGIPVLDIMNEKDVELYVLEISSFQLETTHSLRAKAATILNICEDHMDRYANLEEYVAAKQRIYQGCETAVFNRQDKYTYPKVIPKNMLSFTLDEPRENEFGILQDQQEIFLMKGNEKLLNSQELKIFGRHNIANALAALALGETVGLPMPKMLTALRKFTGLPHRCQLVCERDGVSWYNDSKGTNVGATVAALEGLGSTHPGKIVLIAGGVGKGADFTPLQKPVKKFVRKLILIGEAAPQLQRVLEDYANIIHADSLQQAVELAELNAIRGDKVLLSPACASYDMFNNFEHRGEEFTRLVQVL